MDVIQSQYLGQAPATHKQGLHLIDGIYESDSLVVIKGGYNSGTDELSDHRLVSGD